MTIYSLYIFDRHCDCIYYQDWHRKSPVRAPTAQNARPKVHRLPSSHATTTTTTTTDTPARPSIFDQPPQSTDLSSNPSNPPLPFTLSKPAQSTKGLPFDEEAKLVYGVVLSLRNMVKKLSGKQDEAFLSYRTPSYRLHLFETMTGYRFVLLSDPQSESLRFVLRQVYQGPFVDFVARNPLVDMDSRTEGIDNDQFRAAVDRHMRALTVFA